MLCGANSIWIFSKYNSIHMPLPVSIPIVFPLGKSGLPSTNLRGRCKYHIGSASRSARGPSSADYVTQYHWLYAWMGVHCDWLYVGQLWLAVLCCSSGCSHSNHEATASTCVSASRSMSSFGLCCQIGHMSRFSSLTWFKVAKSGWKCAQSGNTDGLS